MFVAGHYCFEVFDVMVMFIMDIILVNQLLRIHKDVGYLFLHLTTNLHSYYRIAFGFNKQFTLPTFKKTYFCDMQPKVDFMINTGQKTVKLFYFRNLNFEHRTRMFQKLLSSLFQLMFLQTNITRTVLAVLRSIEYFAHSCL